MNTGYLEFVQNAASREELATQTYEYLKNSGYAAKALLLHQHRPQALSVLHRNEDTFSAEDWAQRIREGNLPDQPDFMESGKDYFSFIGGRPPYRQPFYLFVFSSAPSAEVKEILRAWQRLDRMTVQIERSIKEEFSVEWANLISQLLHDTSSLMQLASQGAPSEELQKRLKYQTHVQDNLLFYIRPVDLIRSPLPVKDLIRHALQMSNLDHQNFSLTISEEVTDIVIDAETFAKAFNEIVRNALTAVEEQPDKISITVDREGGNSPFLTYDWIKITVRDKGKGIIADFVDYIGEPFFTTRKSEGHGGFGLTNAKKIIEAHEGQLIIESEPEEGTAVTFYLPMLNADDYE